MNSNEALGFQPEGLSLREAIEHGFTLFQAAFNRRYGPRAVDGYLGLMVGYEPKDVMRAAERIARSGSEAPTPGAWMEVAKDIAWSEGRYGATPWSRPPWSHLIARDPPKLWGTNGHGGYFWLAGAHPRFKHAAGEAWAFDEFGVARKSGILVVDPKGFLFFVPNGQRPQDQPGWDREGPTLLEGLKEIARAVAANGAGLADSRFGAQHVSVGILEAMRSW